MRVLVSADWHFDAWLRADTNPFGGIADVLDTLDALILAGDLSNDPGHGWPNLFGYLKYLIDPEKVWVVPGNHDYYGWDLQDDGGLQAIAEQAGGQLRAEARCQARARSFPVLHALDRFRADR